MREAEEVRAAVVVGEVGHLEWIRSGRLGVLMESWDGAKVDAVDDGFFERRRSAAMRIRLWLPVQIEEWSLFRCYVVAFAKVGDGPSG